MKNLIIILTVALCAISNFAVSQNLYENFNDCSSWIMKKTTPPISGYIDATGFCDSPPALPGTAFMSSHAPSNPETFLIKTHNINSGRTYRVKLKYLVGGGQGDTDAKFYLSNSTTNLSIDRTLIQGTQVPTSGMRTYEFTATKNYSVIGLYLFSGTSYSMWVDSLALTDITCEPFNVSISSSNTSICEGTNVLLTSSATTTVTSYQWKRNGTNISGATSSTYSTQLAGSYTLSAMNSFGCSYTSSARVITVIATPQPFITQETDFCTFGSTTLTAYGYGATAYSWSTSETSSSITVYSPGNYSVIAQYGNCYSTSTSHSISACEEGPCPPGFECLGGEMAVSEIYPNTADRQVNIRLSKAPETNMPYAIYNQFGVVVKRGTFHKGESQSAVETADLPNGLYIFHVQTGTGTIKEKLLVNHE